MAIEIVDCPIQNGGSFRSFLYVSLPGRVTYGLSSPWWSHSLPLHLGIQTPLAITALPSRRDSAWTQIFSWFQSGKISILIPFWKYKLIFFGNLGGTIHPIFANFRSFKAKLTGKYRKCPAFELKKNGPTVPRNSTTLGLGRLAGTPGKQHPNIRKSIASGNSSVNVVNQIINH